MKSTGRDLSQTEPKLPPRFFYGIGAHKAGTTWVHSVLAQHPDVFLPYFKEALYFSSVNLSPWLLNPFKRCLIGFKRLVIPAALQTWFLNRHRLFKNRVHNHLWRRCLLVGQRNDAWYISLFEGQDAGVLCGEISPEYAVLPEDDIARMAALAPQAKILFIMRDPAQRVWSNYRFMKLRGRKVKAADLKAIKRYIEAPAAVARTDYYATMLRYETYFPRENIHYMFYEDMLDDPRAFAADLCDFLGLDAKKIPSDVLEKRVNVSKKADIPADIEAALYEAYQQTCADVEKHVGRIPAQWKRA